MMVCSRWNVKMDKFSHFYAAHPYGQIVKASQKCMLMIAHHYNYYNYFIALYIWNALHVFPYISLNLTGLAISLNMVMRGYWNQRTWHVNCKCSSEIIGIQDL